MAMTFVVFVMYGSLAHTFRSLLIESASVQRCLRYGFAMAFAGLGAKLALTEKMRPNPFIIEWMGFIMRLLLRVCLGEAPADRCLKDALLGILAKAPNTH